VKFKIGVILSITHGRLLCEIGEVYKILNYMLDDILYTHQLPRAGRFAKSFVTAQHPQLEEWNNIAIKINRENWKDYLHKAEQLFGESLEIEKVPAGLWTHKEPVEEAEEIAGKDKVITIENRSSKLDDRRN
jgi:hypothetical protein